MAHTVKKYSHTKLVLFLLRVTAVIAKLLKSQFTQCLDHNSNSRYCSTGRQLLQYRDLVTAHTVCIQEDSHNMKTGLLESTMRPLHGHHCCPKLRCWTPTYHVRETGTWCALTNSSAMRNVMCLAWSAKSPLTHTIRTNIGLKVCIWTPKRAQQTVSVANKRYIKKIHCTIPLFRKQNYPWT